MKTLNDFSMLASDSCRSRAYLSGMLKNNMKPASVILIKLPSVAGGRDENLRKATLYNNTASLEEVMIHNDIPYNIIQVNTINDSKVITFLKSISQQYVIFSIPGYILGKDFFSIKKKYLHIHPGNTPNYRGSTPMYYSILKEKKLTATAIFLEQKIDVGPILGFKNYPLPTDGTALDVEYDPWMRSDLLVEILTAYCENNVFRTTVQEKGKGETYYIIHPVLKCLAINSINFNTSNKVAL